MSDVFRFKFCPKKKSRYYLHRLRWLKCFIIFSMFLFCKSSRQFFKWLHLNVVVKVSRFQTSLPGSTNRRPVHLHDSLHHGRQMDDSWHTSRLLMQCSPQPGGFRHDHLSRLRRLGSLRTSHLHARSVDVLFCLIKIMVLKVYF